ncbi:MAG: translocation/assembly module TamB domain-containing protein [Novosphingobium sp.]|nr:translocation/assembly module TamB domain-containing protein [Novosphingobium sp.]
MAQPDSGPGDDGAPQQPRARGARWRSFVLQGLALLAGVFVLGLVVLNSPIGHRFVVDQIAKVAPASGLRISIGRIEGSLYGEAVLDDVTLSDPKGPFLKVPKVELDWRPFNWFFRGLDIRKVIAYRGVLLRPPELEPGDPDAPILPDFDIRIDRVVLEDFTVAEGVLGEARKVQLEAKADIRSGRVYILMDDLGGSDELALLVDAWPDGDKFDLALDYNAPRGGLLASLAGADSAFVVRISGKGTWTKWDGRVVATQDDEKLAALRLTNRSGQYGLLGQAYPGRLLEGLPARAAGEALSVSAGGTLENSELDGKLALVGDGFYLTGNGGIDLGDNAFRNFTVRTILRDENLFGSDFAVKGASGTAWLDGPFRDLSIRHALVVKELDAGTRLVGLRQQGTARLEEGKLSLPLDIAVGRIVTGTQMIDPRLANGRFGGTITLDGNALASDNLSADFKGLAARMALRGDLARGGYALAGPVAAQGLELENLGAINANAKIVFRIGERKPWSLLANFAGTMPRVTNGTLTTIAGTGIRFKGGVSLGADRPVVFRDTSLNASKLSLALSGEIAGGETRVAGRGRHADYGPFTVKARMAGDGPHAELVFASPFPAADLREVHVALAPIAEGFRIDTHGGSMLGPFKGALDLYAQPNEPVRLAIDNMAVSQTSISGDVTLEDGGASGLLALTGGGLDGTITLTPKPEGQGIGMALQARNASFAGPPPIMVRKADINMDAVLAAEGLQASGTVYAQGLSRGSLFIGRLGARADVKDGQGTVTASLTGRRGSDFELQGQGAFAPGQISLIARGAYAGQRIAMPRRAVLTKEDDGWRLAPAQVSFGKGMIIAEGQFGGEGPARGKVQMADMPLSLVDVVVEDMALGGKASGIVNFEADKDGVPTGSARLAVKSLSRTGLLLSSRPIDLYLVADLAPRRLEARAVVDEGGERRGRVQARIVNMPRDGALYDRLSAGALFAQMRYSGPVDALWRLAAIDAFDLTGTIDVAADASGSLIDPKVRGSLGGDAMRMRSALTGTDVKDISARGSFAGSTLRLTSFAGTPAKGGGSISGSGVVDLSAMRPGYGPRIDLRLAARDAQILDRREMGATVTGPLRIRSNGNGGVIAGRLKVDKARWQLGNAADVRELPNIRTREINTPADVAPVRRPGGKWRFMIDARGDSRLMVRGMGMDSEWGADIRLRGTTADPRIGGKAEVVRGSYEFAGTRFDLTRGRIAFDESVPIDPRLDIKAETDVQDLAVTVTVKGSATQPEITFASVPSLPEEEILARLLFGGSIADLSATDALQLGSALASLRGGGGMDPINKLRSAIGLDRLRIVSADPALGRETSVAMGKNIGRKLYVEIVTDGQGYSATELEYRITRWLSLLGTVSTIGRESVTVEVSKDY